MTRDREIHDCYSLNASEYLDLEDVFLEKVVFAAHLIRQAKGFVVAYTGAGISTAAGIQDYASKKNSVIYKDGFAGEGQQILSIIPSREERERMEATETHDEKQCRIIQQKADAASKCPTLGHHAMALLHKSGYLQYWVQQNHDRLSQKAGYPSESLNEIHGAWWDALNPVRGIKKNNALRADLLSELHAWKEKEKLCLTVGTTLSGFNADQIATHAAFTEGKDLIIIGIQQTPYDADCSLRIWGTSDKTLAAITKELLGQDVHLPDPELEKIGLQWWEDAMGKSKEHQPCRRCKQERIGVWYDTPLRGKACPDPC
jgi:NAD-dependent SIR2 family protein deacetylase